MRGSRSGIEEYEPGREHSGCVDFENCEAEARLSTFVGTGTGVDEPHVVVPFEIRSVAVPEYDSVDGLAREGRPGSQKGSQLLQSRLVYVDKRMFAW